jgi:hypothetical protein
VPKRASRAPFAGLSPPVVSIRRIGTGQLLIADQLGQLLLVSCGHSKTIAAGVGRSAVRAREALRPAKPSEVGSTVGVRLEEPLE